MDCGAEEAADGLDTVLTLDQWRLINPEVAVVLRVMASLGLILLCLTWKRFDFWRNMYTLTSALLNLMIAQYLKDVVR